MTIADAIKHLQRIQRQHGDEVPVFFDCPNCRQSFEPALAEADVKPVLRVQAAPSAEEKYAQALASL